MDKTYKVLFELHDIDKAIVDINQKIQEIPIQINQRQSTLDTVTQQLNTARQKLKQQKIDQDLKDVELKELENKIKELESKRWNLKSNKELSTLQHEVSFLEEKKDNTEKEIILFMLSEEDQQADIKHLEHKQVQEGRIISREIEELKKILEENQNKLAEFTRRREEISSGLEDDIRERYNLILKNRKGIATSILDSHVCTQCGIRVRPQTINEVRSQKKICFCEGCNRILLYSEENNNDNGLG